MDLRPYQTDAIDRLRQSIAAGRKRIMLQAATGSGKTVIAGAIIQRALDKGKRVTFCVPALSLIDQTVSHLYAEGITDVGVQQANHPMTSPSKPVQICSVQTLLKRDLMLADLVIVDEAHKIFDLYLDWMGRPEWAKVPFIGLSATPWSKGLGRLYEELIVVRTTEDLINDGFLSPFRVFAPSHPDLSAVKTIAGDYQTSGLSGVMSDKALVADVVETWRTHASDRPTFVFAVDRAHAAALQEQFIAAGIPTGYCDYKVLLEEREDLRRKFERGDIQVVVSVQTMTTGIDWPSVSCIVLARPTKSEMLYVQMVGRGLRIKPQGGDCLILDHSNTTERMGFVTNLNRDKDYLDDGKTRKSSDGKPADEALPQICTKCSFLKPPKVSTCPHCGFEAKRQSKIRNEAGELVELSASRKPVETVAGKLAKLAPNGVLQGMLATVAKERGYKDGWVANKYRSITGHWPRQHYVDFVTPTADLRMWLKSEQIRYAKGIGKNEVRRSA